MIVISNALVLSLASPGSTLNRPLVGWHNLVTPANVSASSVDAAYPASNLANPSTALEWRADAASPLPEFVYLEVSLSVPADCDYVGLARHNFGSSGATVAVEYLDTSASPATWTEIVQEYGPADDAPIVMRWEPGLYQDVRLRIKTGSEPPALAVLYLGLLTKLPRNLYVGHSPMNFGRRSQVIGGMSTSGDFLGRIVLTKSLTSEVSMPNVPPSTYRTDVDPFFQAAIDRPFFWAWRPYSYPTETAFAWMTDDPDVSNQLPNGFMQIAWRMQGVAS